MNYRTKTYEEIKWRIVKNFNNVTIDFLLTKLTGICIFFNQTKSVLDTFFFDKNLIFKCE